MKGAYLSLDFGSKQFENSKTKMEDIIDKVRKLIKEENFPFIKDTDFNLVMNLESNGFRPKSYEKSSVLFRYYDKNDFPDENTLRNDLREYLEIYKFIKNNYQFELLVEEEDDSKPTGTLEDFKESKFEKYSNEDFLNEVFISSENYKILKKLLANKKNLILQGAPGVGKTFVAKRLAYAELLVFNSIKVIHMKTLLKDTGLLKTVMNFNQELLKSSVKKLTKTKIMTISSL